MEKINLKELEDFIIDLIDDDALRRGRFYYEHPFESPLELWETINKNIEERTKVYHDWTIIIPDLIAFARLLDMLKKSQRTTDKTPQNGKVIEKNGTYVYHE